jgi:hypothetical protein
MKAFIFGSVDVRVVGLVWFVEADAFVGLVGFVETVGFVLAVGVVCAEPLSDAIRRAGSKFLDNRVIFDSLSVFRIN